MMGWRRGGWEGGKEGEGRLGENGRGRREIGGENEGEGGRRLVERMRERKKRH